jgi:RNA polymerase sigma-70 factor (sigma-E family)
VRRRTAARHPRSRQEFEHFVADHVDGLLRAAYLITWDFAEAEDLVQECLFRVARRWPRVRAMEHSNAYARKVLVNLALDEGRRRTRQRSELALSGARAVEQHEDEAAVRVLGWVETNTDLTTALGRLAPRQRATLVLRYFDDLSEAQVAEVMGCSVGTVKSTTSRAVQRLREEVMATEDTEAKDTEAKDTEAKDTETKEGSITR